MCRRERSRGFSRYVGFSLLLFSLCFSGGLAWSQETPANSTSGGSSSSQSLRQPILNLRDLSRKRLAISETQKQLSTQQSSNALSLQELYSQQTPDLNAIELGINGSLSWLEKLSQTQQQAQSSVTQATSSTSQSTEASKNSQQLSQQINQVTDKEVQALRNDIAIWRTLTLFFAGTTIGYAVDGPRGALIGGGIGAAGGGVLWLLRFEMEVF